MSVFWSILAALAGLIVYMLIRFKFTAGMATVLALAHDVLMICALMAIFQIQINASFIAAVLTVMAYSINNSLVVFDRVRNYEKNNTNNDTLEQIINKSIIGKQLDLSFEQLSYHSLLHHRIFQYLY